MNRKITDAFIFYNELDMLEFRLKELNDMVDIFVIVEATRTFTGNKKPLFFEESKHRFSAYLNKIIHVVVNDMPCTGSAWDNERHQRRCIDRGLTKLKLQNSDIVIISDCDEIPDINSIKNSKYLRRMFFKKVCALEMDMYYYNLTCRGDKWYHAKALTWETYRHYNSDAEGIRHARKPKKIKNGGWHFSYFSDVDHIILKVRNFSEQQWNSEEFLDAGRIQEKIRNCEDLFSRGNPHNFHRVAISDNGYLPVHYKMLNANN